MDNGRDFPEPEPWTPVQREPGRRSGRNGVCLTLVVPAGKRKHMCRILKPIVKDVRELAYFLDVTERGDNSGRQEAINGFCAPNYTVSSRELSAPALAVMLFPPEQSETVPDVNFIRQKFLRFPWRYHHAIQLQSAAKTSCLLGQQDFYFLSRQLPLWNVSPGVHKTATTVRFNIFVRRFNAMVEFYRLVTNSEMESRKAGFCVFPLSPRCLLDTDVGVSTNDDRCSRSPPSITCELALKQCSLVNPYPLADGYLSFPVSDVHSLLKILPTQASSLPNHRYLVHDPDGNALVLYESSVYNRDNTNLVSEIPTALPSNMDQHQHQTHSVMDKSSENGFSVDSGRYSDFESSSLELETCMSKLVEEVDLLKNRAGGRNGSSPACLSEAAEQSVQNFSQYPGRGVNSSCVHSSHCPPTDHGCRTEVLNNTSSKCFERLICCEPPLYNQTNNSVCNNSRKMNNSQNVGCGTVMNGEKQNAMHNPTDRRTSSDPRHRRRLEPTSSSCQCVHDDELLFDQTCFAQTFYERCEIHGREDRVFRGEILAKGSTSYSETEL